MTIRSLHMALGASSLALCALLPPIALSSTAGADPALPNQDEAAEEEKPIELDTFSCHVLEGQNVAIVTTTNGLIRRVELDSLEATAEAREHVGPESWVLVREVEGGRLVTLDFEGRGYVRSSKTLKPVGRFSVGVGYGAAAFHPAGKSIARVRNRREIAVGMLSEAPTDPVVLKCAGDVKDIRYSSDGKQLVALLENGYHFIEKGKLGELITLPVGFEARMVEFIGDKKLAVGSGNGDPEAPVEVLIVDAKTGTWQRVIEAPYQAAPLGGIVSSLRFHPESGRLVFGISSAGSVLAVDPDTGEFLWDINFGGGNPGGIGVVHPKGSKRCFSHGMTAQHRAAFSWDTGKRLSADRLHGFSFVSGTADDRMTIGVQHGRLILVDSETYASVLRRVEYANPLAGSVAVFSGGR